MFELAESTLPSKTDLNKVCRIVISSSCVGLARRPTTRARVSHFVLYNVLIGPDITWLTGTKRIWKIVFLLCNRSRAYKHIMELSKPNCCFLKANDRHETSTPPQRSMLRGAPLVKYYKPFLYRYNSYWPSLSARNLPSMTYFENVTLGIRVRSLVLEFRYYLVFQYPHNAMCVF